MLNFFKKIFGTGNSNTAFTRLDANMFKTAITNSNCLLIDVRTPGEYQTGKIADAKLINVMAADFKTKLNKLDKNKPLYLYCKGGVRSKRGAKQAVSLGFNEVYDLKGGITSFH